MASADSSDRLPATPNHAIKLNCFHCVLAARGGKAAIGTEQRTDSSLIKTYTADHQSFNHAGFPPTLPSRLPPRLPLDRFARLARSANEIRDIRIA